MSVMSESKKTTRKKKNYPNAYISSFCKELAIIIKSGISVTDGILLLSDEEKDKEKRKTLLEIMNNIENGGNLHIALESTGLFPDYAIEMIEIGEQTGRIEPVLFSLAKYYDRQAQIKRNIKSAVVYPSILVVMLLTVVFVLIIKVLPIFNDVFAQLGTSMSPIAVAMMNFGNVVSNCSLYIILAVLIIALIICVLTRIAKTKAVILKLVYNMRIYRLMSSARFASALSMTLSSGLNIDESLEMSQKLVKNPVINSRIADCQSKMQEGESFANAVVETGIFTSVYSRMIAIGFKTGHVDSVMEDIAEKSEESLDAQIEKSISRFEPTLVIIMSVIVGLILLSVMLPLMGIMTAIG